MRRTSSCRGTASRPARRCVRVGGIPWCSCPRSMVEGAAARGGLGVVDDLRVRVAVELLRVWAATRDLVERVDRRDLVRGQGEVEDAEVLGDAVRLDRLGDRAGA